MAEKKKEKAGDRVAILDAGTPYAKRLDRACRELNVETVVIPLETPAPSLKQRGYKALLVAGGKGSINSFDAPWYDSGLFSIGVPVLAVNYGMCMLNKTYGGTIESKGGRQTGEVDVTIESGIPLFNGCKGTERVMLTHGESIKKLGSGLKAIAHWRKEIVGIADVGKNLYGLRFHPEMIMTAKGKKMMENFLVSIAKVKQHFTVASREARILTKMMGKTAGRPVVMLCSGGLHSIVGAMVLKEAIGTQNLMCLCVQTGFEKKGSIDAARAAMFEIGCQFKVLTANTLFYAAQTTVPDRANPTHRRRLLRAMVDQTEPEDKRLICRDTLYRLAEKFLQETFDGEACIGVGATRGDIIDLGMHLAHHQQVLSRQYIANVDVLRKFRHEDRLIEPVAEFHKREVVQEAKRLKAPDEVMKSHPFPSEVGLSIRVVSMHIVHVGRHFAETQVLAKCVADFSKVKADHALMNIIDASTDADDKKELKEVSKRTRYKATVMPLEVVGMHGSKKTYYYACALSDNKDFGVKWADVFYIGAMITRVCHDINRCCYAFGGVIQPIVRDVTPTYVTRAMIRLVREADDLAHEVLKDKGVFGKVDQMPVVLIPVHFDRGLLSLEPSARHSIVLRPFKSSDLLSGTAAVPGKDIPNDALQEIVNAIKKLPGVSRVLYDVTTKPPAHIEWQ